MSVHLIGGGYCTAIQKALGMYMHTTVDPASYIVLITIIDRLAKCRIDVRGTNVAMFASRYRDNVVTEVEQHVIVYFSSIAYFVFFSVAWYCSCLYRTFFSCKFQSPYRLPYFYVKLYYLADLHQPINCTSVHRLARQQRKFQFSMF